MNKFFCIYFIIQRIINELQLLILITNPGAPNKGQNRQYYNEYNVEDGPDSGQLSAVGQR